MDVDHRTGTHKMTIVELLPKNQCWTTATLSVTVAIEAYSVGAFKHFSYFIFIPT